MSWSGGGSTTRAGRTERDRLSTAAGAFSDEAQEDHRRAARNGETRPAEF